MMKKYQTYYTKIYDPAVADKLYPSKKFRKPEVVVPEPLPEKKPFIRVSPNVVKRPVPGQNKNFWKLG
jgi:hypothetical protein